MTSRNKQLGYMLTSAALAIPIYAHAEKPLDCSKGPIPNKALQLSIGAQKVPALPVTTLREGNQVTSGGKNYTQWQFSVRDKDRSATTEARFAVLIPQGEKPDGRTFRMLQKADAKPAAEPGPQDVQTWAVEASAFSVDANNVQFSASLRVEFGKRHGDVLPGKVYLCVPGGQTNKELGTKLDDALTLAGRFEAKLR